MKAQELIEELEYAIQQNGGDVEVRMAQQPKWAFEYSIRGAVTAQPNAGEDCVVYLEEGSQLGYLPEGAAMELGW